MEDVCEAALGADNHTIDIDQAVADLYRLDPSEFVVARDGLVRQLRASGQREAAARVRKARRPTLAAWAVNQLAAQFPERVEALRDAGAALRQAQQHVLSGARGADLRRAAEHRRRLVDNLTAQAVALLEDAGHPAGVHADAIASTLLAASADPDAGEEVRRGRLTKELPAPSSFGDLTGLLVTAPPGTAPPGTAPPPEDARGRRRADDQRDRELAEARAAIATAAQQLDAAEQALASAQAEAARRHRATAQASAEADRLERQAQAARRHATSIQHHADRADDTAADAAQQVARLRQQLDAARARLHDPGA